MSTGPGSWNPGTRIGRWEVTGALGVDDLGPVFEAKHWELGGRMTLRVLRERAGSADDVLSALDALRFFQHPGAMPFLARGTTPEGEPYAVWEDLEGRSFTELTMPVRPSTLRRVALAVAALLEAAHKLSLPHLRLTARDVVVQHDAVLVRDIGLRPLLGVPGEAADDLLALGTLLSEAAGGALTGALRDVVRDLLAPDPSRRPTPREVIDRLAPLPDEAPRDHASARRLRLGLGDDAAAAVYEAALRAMPRSAPLHLQHGRALFRLGRTAEARAAFREAMLLDPDDRAALHYLALSGGAGRELQDRAYLEWKHFERHDSHEMLLGHGPDAVFATAFAPDGRTLYTAGADGLIAAWPDARKPLQPLARIPAPQLALAISPDAKWLLSGGRDGALLFVEAATGTIAARHPAHSGGVHAIAISSDGRRALTGGPDGACLWDLPARRVVTRFETVGAVIGAAFSPDGKRFALAGKGLLVLDAGGRGEWAVWEQPGGFECVAFAEDSAVLLTGGRDHWLRVWDAAAGVEADAPLAFDGAVSALAPRDAEYVWAAAHGFQLKLYHVPTGAVLCSLRPVSGFPRGLSCVPGIVACGGDLSFVDVWRPGHAID